MKIVVVTAAPVVFFSSTYRPPNPPPMPGGRPSHTYWTYFRQVKVKSPRHLSLLVLIGPTFAPPPVTSINHPPRSLAAAALKGGSIPSEIVICKWLARPSPTFNVPYPWDVFPFFVNGLIASPTYTIYIVPGDFRLSHQWIIDRHSRSNQRSDIPSEICIKYPSDLFWTPC